MLVAAQVRRDYLGMYPAGDKLLVPRAFSRAMDCFTGRDPEYLPIDARYHDLEHTLQGTLCLSTLLRGWQLAGASPQIPQKMFELCLFAILLHDTGYLKRRTDTRGTGAKYTITHVQRSCDFAERLLSRLGHRSDDIGSIQRMIRCTGMGTDVSRIEFASEPERICGFALGTADLLGQMAAEDYVEKLPVLYEEFAEAGRYSGQAAVPFSSVDDLMRKTPGFWENYVLKKIDRDFTGLYRYLAEPPPDGPNPYVARITSNLQRLEHVLAVHD
jgi:hypothetical protein